MLTWVLYKSLRPNGALLYASDFLDANITWLLEQIATACIAKNPSFKLHKEGEGVKEGEVEYSLTLFFDLPGQMELYLQSDSLKSVISKLVSRFHLKACLLELFDATYISEINSFLSMCLVTLTTGINIEMPHISLISKIDVPPPSCSCCKRCQDTACSKSTSKLPLSKASAVISGYGPLPCYRL